MEKDATKIEVRTSVPGIEHRDSGQEVLRRLTKDTTENRYPAQVLAQIFTDGSATDTVKAGGVGVLIKLSIVVNDKMLICALGIFGKLQK